MKEFIINKLIEGGSRIMKSTLLKEGSRRGNKNKPDRVKIK